MPNSVATIQACLLVQQNIADILGSSNPWGRYKYQTGFTDAIISPENTNGFEAIQIGAPRPGSEMTLSVYYHSNICDPVNAGIPEACDVYASNDSRGDTLINLTQYNHVAFTISRSEYMQFCETYSDVLSMKTMEAAQQLRRAENEYYISQFLNNVCNYSNGEASAPGSGTEQTLKLFDSSGRPNAMALFKVQNNYNRLGYGNVTPLLVGGTGLNAWQYSTGVFTGNVEGNDPTRVPFGMDTFIDYKYDEIIADGNKHVATMVPGTMQRLLWHRYIEGSDLRIAQEHITKTTLEIGGELWDYTIHNDGCNDYVTVTVGRGFDTFFTDQGDLIEYYKDADNCGQGGCPRHSWITDCGELDCSDTINVNDPIAP